MRRLVTASQPRCSRRVDFLHGGVGEAGLDPIAQQESHDEERDDRGDRGRRQRERDAEPGAEEDACRQCHDRPRDGELRDEYVEQPENEREPGAGRFRPRAERGEGGDVQEPPRRNEPHRSEREQRDPTG